MNIPIPFTIDIDGLKEDARKIGIGLILAGLINLFVNEFHNLGGLYALVIGATIWARGLMAKKEKSQ